MRAARDDAGFSLGLLPHALSLFETNPGVLIRFDVDLCHLLKRSMSAPRLISRLAMNLGRPCRAWKARKCDPAGSVLTLFDRAVERVLQTAYRPDLR